jgi:nucleoside-diphosphate-sugar epimerase
MRALVTGSTGFIGSHLVQSLLDKKYEVRCLIREQSDQRWIKDKNVQIVSGSYRDQESLRRAVRGMDVVFHAAAVITAFDWDTYYAANVEATENLLEACAEAALGLKKFVFVSSISASGPAVDKKPKREDDPCLPVSLYGKSKRLAEEKAARFSATLPIVIIRPTNVLGPRQKQLYDTLTLAVKRIVPQMGNGDRQTTLVFVQDVVRALILAAEKEEARGRTYFVADPQPRSWREITDLITRCLGLSLVIKLPHWVLMTIALLSERAARLTGGRPLLTRRALLSVRRNYWLQDTGLIQRDLGFSPEISFEEGMREIIEWYKNRGLI